MPGKSVGCTFVTKYSPNIPKLVLTGIFCEYLRSAIHTADIELLKEISWLNRSNVNTEFDHDGHDCMKTTVFMYACFKYMVACQSHRETLKEIFCYLVTAGACVDLTSSVSGQSPCALRRTTPLIAAIVKPDWELVSLLLSCGADPNGRDDEERSPLEMALCYKWDNEEPRSPADEEDFRIAGLLIDKGADPNILKDGKRLIVHALSSRNVFACKMLARANGNLSFTTEDGFTPLHSAALWGNVTVVKAFIEAGADITAKTAGVGQTPLEVYKTGINAREFPIDPNSDIIDSLTFSQTPRKRTRSDTGAVPRSGQKRGNGRYQHVKASGRPTSRDFRRSSSQAQMQDLMKLQQLATQILGINLLPDSDTEKENVRVEFNKQLLRAENFSSKNKLSFAPKHLSLVCERQQSVCKIEWPGGSGTGSLLSKFKILTANHIYEWMFDALKHSPDPSMYRVMFEDKTGVYTFANKEPLSREKDLDYAILELDVSDGQCRGLEDLIPLGSFISDTLEKNDVVVVVGHPGGKSKTVDFCPVAGLDERYAIHVLFDNPNFPREDPHKATYHTSVMFHGSSGSAGFDRNGNLVLMHTRGFFPVESQTSLIEEGVRLSSIREHARQNLAPEVFNEIFPQRQGGFSFGQ